MLLKNYIKGISKVFILAVLVNVLLFSSVEAAELSENKSVYVVVNGGFAGGKTSWGALKTQVLKLNKSNSYFSGTELEF